MSPDHAARTLKTAAVLTLLFGFALILAPHVALLRPIGRLFVDLAFLTSDQAPDLGPPVAHLMFAISGGLMVGLAVLIWQVTALIHPRDPALARRLLIPTLLGWYVTDCFGSALSGAGFNLVMNSAFLALFLVPLLLARPAARPRVSP